MRWTSRENSGKRLLLNETIYVDACGFLVLVVHGMWGAVYGIGCIWEACGKVFFVPSPVRRVIPRLLTSL